jgi:cytochrome P450
MPTAEARIPTHRASRYLTQLCRHTAQVGALALDHEHHHRQEEGIAPTVAASTPRRAECSGTSGVIEFEGGRCALRATGEELILLAEADDQQQLRLIQEALTTRLQRLGHRDQLAFTWRPVAEPNGRDRSAGAILEKLTTPAGRADPFPLYAAAHELGPVPALTDGLFLICGYAAVNQVLREPRFGLAETAPSTSRDDALRSMNRSILRANPPDHGRMRSLISKVFTPRRIAALQPAIEEAVNDLLDQLAETAADSAPVDFMDHVAFPLPVTVICELLGVPPADRRSFRPLAADLTEALELSGTASASADAAARELAGYFTDLIDERHKAPGDDLISALVAARDAEDGRLSDEELLANLILLLVAGFETTTNLLGNGLAILLDHPDLTMALRTEQIPIASFIEEVLRHDSPVQAVTRQAHADGLTVEGVPIPRGSDLIVLIGAANRDPARYNNPDRFDPSRTDIRPLSFGAGPHICIGNGLARLEAAVAFPRLLTRFPNLSTSPGRQPVRRDRLVLRGHQTLPIQITGPEDGRWPGPRYPGHGG